MIVPNTNRDRHESEAEVEKELLKTFPSGFLKIVSLDHPSKDTSAGVVSEVSVKVAARHIVDSTADVAEKQ